MHPDTEAAILAAFDAAAGELAATTATTAQAVAEQHADALLSSETYTTAGKSIGSKLTDLLHTGESAVMGGMRDDDGTFLPSGASVLNRITSDALTPDSQPLWEKIVGYLPLSPLLKGIAGLFTGGGSEPEPEPLSKYALPPAIAFSAGEDRAGDLDKLDYDQAGRPRLYSPFNQPAPAAAGNQPDPAQQQPPQQTFNLTIQALDSRSILDRAPDIAAAVRDAMLNNHQLNDVVTDL